MKNKGKRTTNEKKIEIDEEKKEEKKTGRKEEAKTKKINTMKHLKQFLKKEKTN